MTTAMNIRHTLYRAPTNLPDPGSGGTIMFTIDGGVCHVVTAEAESRTLAQPTKSGITGTVVAKTLGGALTLTVTDGYNYDGDTSLTFDNAGDFVTFISIEYGGSYYWRVLGYEGVNVALEDMSVDQLTIGSMKSTVTTVAAAGNNQANAAALSFGMNIVTNADNSVGVRLPTGVANAIVEIISVTNAKSLKVYPASGGTISGLSGDAALTVGATNLAAAAGSQLCFVRLVATNTTQWYVAAS